LAVGSWQLAVGSWQLAVGSWQLAVGIQVLISQATNYYEIKLCICGKQFCGAKTKPRLASLKNAFPSSRQKHFLRSKKQNREPVAKQFLAKQKQKKQK
jgi:hypothetical protein